MSAQQKGKLGRVSTKPELLQGELSQTQRRQGTEQTASSAREERRPSSVHTEKTSDAQHPRQQGCSSWSTSGLAVYTLYLFATVLYFYIRVAHTLDLGRYRWYGLHRSGNNCPVLILFACTFVASQPDDATSS